MSEIKDRLIPTDLEHEMRQSFISYAMSVIVDRPRRFPLPAERTSRSFRTQLDL